MQTQAGRDRLGILQHRPLLRKKVLVLGLSWFALASCTAAAYTTNTNHFLSLHSDATLLELAAAMEELFHIIAVGCATILVFVSFPGSVAVLVECLLPRRKQEAPDFVYEDELIS